MPAIASLMKRLGFVKLADFGLVLTPEGRVLAMRPAVLDDGFGGRIVGWQDGDLAAAELERWEPARPAGKPAVAARPATPPPPLTIARPVAAQPVPRPVAAQPAPRPVVAQPVAPPVAPPMAPMVIAQPVAVVAAPAAPAPVAPKVAAAPIVEEDDWEWTIAMARARAATEDVQEALSTVTAPAPRRMRADTVPPPVQQPGHQGPQPRRPHPATEVTRVAPAPVATATPRTVIPVPTLPTHVKPGTSIFDPSRSLPSPAAPASPRRFAKGTGPHHPSMVSRTRTDDTVPNLTPAPATEDTVTGIALPPVAAARSTPLPSIKRVSRA